MKNFKSESLNIKIIQEGRHLVWKRKHNVLPDASSFLLSGSYDSNIKFWNVENNEFIKTLRGHTDWVLALTLNKNQKHLITSSKDNSVKIWDLVKLECLHTLVHTRCVTSLLYILERDELATGDLNGEIKMWNAKYEYVDSILTASQDPSGVWCLEYISGENLLLIGSEDAKIKIWNLATKACVQVVSGHRDRVHCLVVLNENKIISGSWDCTIKLWKSLGNHSQLNTHPNFKCESTLTGHKFYVIFVAVIKITQEFVSMSEDGTIKIWDINTLKCIKTMTKHTDVITCCHLLLTPYDCELMCDSKENDIKLWSIKSGECQTIFCGHSDVVRCLLIYSKQNSDGK